MRKGTVTRSLQAMSIREFPRRCPVIEWSGRAPAPSASKVEGASVKWSAAMSNQSIATIATLGIDIGMNSFHVVGLDRRGAIVLRQKWSRGQVEVRLAAMPPCLIGMEACVGAHHLSRKLTSIGHDARLMSAKFFGTYSRGHRKDVGDCSATTVGG